MLQLDVADGVVQRVATVQPCFEEPLELPSADSLRGLEEIGLGHVTEPVAGVVLAQQTSEVILAQQLA